MWLGCPKAEIRLRAEKGGGGSSKRGYGYMPYQDDALRLANRESPDFSRGECQHSYFEGSRRQFKLRDAE